MKTRAEKALWFLESFGLSLESIKVKDMDGKVSEVGYENSSSVSKTSFHNLPEKDKETVRALLYIMDKRCVGDAAYHELSMTVNDVPRSYLIKQCRSDLNKIFHIARTPGKHAGAQISFKEELRARSSASFSAVLRNHKQVCCFYFSARPSPPRQRGKHLKILMFKLP